VTPYLTRWTWDLVARRLGCDLREEIVNETLARIWSGSGSPDRSVEGWLHSHAAEEGVAS
jgi:DNA-directed RNA polymerase specialized sigma24 family protein